MCAPRIAEHIAGLATSPDSATLRKLPPAPPGKKWYSSALDTGASINCWNIASVFDRLATSKILLETADGNRLDIDKTGTGSIRALDTTGKPRTLSFGKALFSPKVHNLLSPGAMFEAGTITDIHLHPTGGHVRLCDGTKIPLRAHARLYYLDHLADATPTIGPLADTALTSDTAAAPLAGLPSAAFYEAPTGPLPPVSENTDSAPAQHGRHLRLSTRCPQAAHAPYYITTRTAAQTNAKHPATNRSTTRPPLDWLVSSNHAW
jgi:hypothetical protein